MNHGRNQENLSDCWGLLWIFMQVIVRSKRKSRDLSKVMFSSSKRLLLGKNLKYMRLNNSVFKEKLDMPETTFSFNQKVDHKSIVTAALSNNNGYHLRHIEKENRHEGRANVVVTHRWTGKPSAQDCLCLLLSGMSSCHQLCSSHFA